MLNVLLFVVFMIWFTYDTLSNLNDNYLDSFKRYDGGK